jgi:chromosome segregation protein
MQIDRLRLAGFKSFVDTSELAVAPGLTGIVGPNGCGKSNLVEALRWVMGESSARRLRGGEMDDVIFAGAAGRPARNLAEVALTIDNRARDAAFAVNDRDEIEVVRRIERGGGSSYRINGREVRARDVQLLFADAATGAHSASFVGQGRIAAIIEAKPGERRLLLEEAAGTAGLQTRRRETESRLAAAEDNLARLDDVVATMLAQAETLKKQARQAQRYRRLAEQIRRAEAFLFQARRVAAEAAAAAAAGELRAAERALAEATAQVLATSRARDAVEAALPPLRRDDAAATAEVQRLTHARDGLEAERQRVDAAAAEAGRRGAQLTADLAREDGHLAEAAAALDRLAAEGAALAEAEAAAAPERDRAAAAERAAGRVLAAAEAELQRATEAAAATAARHAALDRRRHDAAERRARLESRRGEAERQRAALAADLVPAAALGEAATAIAAAERQAAACRAALDESEQRIPAVQAEEAAAAAAAREAAARLARLRAEAEAIAALLAPAAPTEGAAPLLSALRVAEGFEAAVGAVFDGELPAVLGDCGSGAAFWAELPPLAAPPPLPPSARSLAEIVTAPAVLERRLALAGWVDSTEAGAALQASLSPGQRLVDADGRLWRWDGFTRMAPAPSATAQHLRQRNRLAALAADIAATEAEVAAVEAAAERAGTARRDAADADRAARGRLRDAESALARARADAAELARRALAAETRLAALADALDKLAADLAEAGIESAEVERDLASLSAPALARAALDAARNDAAARRRDHDLARATLEGLARARVLRRDRMDAAALEEAAWRKRRDGAATHHAALSERRRALDEERAALAARPAAIAAESAALAAAGAVAAARRQQAGDALAAGETALRGATEDWRRAEVALAAAQQRQARCEALCESAAEALARLDRDIDERLGTSAAALPALAGLGAGEAPPEPAATAARLDRLVREREAIGPVNLLAEPEAAEVEARIAGLMAERAELKEAIARLRRGIAALDREGRQRVSAAFEHVNRHFGALFQRLFGGGKAHLALVDDDDPLAAGLEIMASPPGKRLQALSLLSGGEQALTALALLFAIFLTKPAPVCVLDEVDAPLDDANVDRICTLLGEIADISGTRFLLVTHHRITMARVDRLFGVTMAESGVSQLVSVDLARAARLRQTG